MHALSDDGAGDRTLCGRQLLGADSWSETDAEARRQVTCAPCLRALPAPATSMTTTNGLVVPKGWH